MHKQINKRVKAHKMLHCLSSGKNCKKKKLTKVWQNSLANAETSYHSKFPSAFRKMFLIVSTEKIWSNNSVLRSFVWTEKGRPDFGFQIVQRNCKRFQIFGIFEQKLRKAQNRYTLLTISLWKRIFHRFLKFSELFRHIFRRCIKTSSCDEHIRFDFRDVIQYESEDDRLWTKILVAKTDWNVFVQKKKEKLKHITITFATK